MKYIQTMKPITRIVCATQNPGKIQEYKKLFQRFDIKALSAIEIGITGGAREDGKNFQENSYKKARYIADKINDWVIAEDAGLCIDALYGVPGVYSSRWAGENITGSDLNKYTLKKMNHVPADKRTAYFEDILTLISPTGNHWFFKGKVSGVISTTQRGTLRPKLPYDSIFIPHGYDQTYAEMSMNEKNKTSHRAQSVKKLFAFLQENFMENKGVVHDAS